MNDASKFAFALDGLIRSRVKGDGGDEYARKCIREISEAMESLTHPIIDLPVFAPDLTGEDELLDLLEEVMSYDKGMHEDEWIEFCNRVLPTMHRYGRLKSVVGFS